MSPDRDASSPRDGPEDAHVHKRPRLRGTVAGYSPVSGAHNSSDSDSDTDEEPDIDVEIETERREEDAAADHQSVAFEAERRNRLEPVVPSSVTDQLRELVDRETYRRRHDVQRINPVAHNAARVNGNPATADAPSAPLKHFIIPLTTAQWLIVYRAMVDSHINPTPGIEPATPHQLLQFATTYQCAWVDRYLCTIQEIVTDPALVVSVPTRLARDEHLLVQHLFPQRTTQVIDRTPSFPAGGVPLRDQNEWQSLDFPATLLESNTYLRPAPTAQLDPHSTPAAITYDVDSVIIYGDSLPLEAGLEIRAVPNPKATMRYSNRIAIDISGRRIPMSSIPNFRLGQSIRLAVNMMFPSLYIHSSTPTPNISKENQGIIWDELVHPAFDACNSSPTSHVGPGDWRSEKVRNEERGRQISYSDRMHRIQPENLSAFVQHMRQITLDPNSSPFVQSLRGFKFLISLQGSKEWSMIDYNSFVQEELGWMRTIIPRLSEWKTYFRQIMAAKAYLKSLRKATKGMLSDGWLDFTAALDESLAKILRYTDWKRNKDLPNDNAARSPTPDVEVPEEERRRKRKGPSFVLAELETVLRVGGTEVWVDLGIEFFANEHVSIWDQKCGSIVTDTLLGDSSFNDRSYVSGLRLDEIAGIPGLGGYQYTNKLTPLNRINNPIVSLQLYAQEKIPTYKARGNRDKGLGAMHARTLPLNLLLDARSGSESTLEKWVDNEVAIFHSASARKHLAARCEIRTNLVNFLDGAWNMTLARELINDSQYMVHVDKVEWFEWKALRAVNFAALPAAIFRLYKSVDPWVRG
ncbi:hypothetical protein QFC22_004719 [Naganishia vaughanmartiniae]|uniref:Uncharacterized protein n=1 Tax=Naganishia vaughanmartiniae TaxID=1424756 RepID=A0ACC2WYV1_9TREE|nr:hypothetical protein QFC22_004719 [Naganishia vaughanmartiniae]